MEENEFDKIKNLILTCLKRLETVICANNNNMEIMKKKYYHLIFQGHAIQSGLCITGKN